MHDTPVPSSRPRAPPPWPFPPAPSFAEKFIGEVRRGSQKCNPGRFGLHKNALIPSQRLGVPRRWQRQTSATPVAGGGAAPGRSFGEAAAGSPSCGRTARGRCGAGVHTGAGGRAGPRRNRAPRPSTSPLLRRRCGPGELLCKIGVPGRGRGGGGGLVLASPGALIPRPSSP